MLFKRYKNTISISLDITNLNITTEEFKIYEIGLVSHIKTKQNITEIYCNKMALFIGNLILPPEIKPGMKFAEISYDPSYDTYHIGSMLQLDPDKAKPALADFVNTKFGLCDKKVWRPMLKINNTDVVTPKWDSKEYNEVIQAISNFVNAS